MYSKNDIRHYFGPVHYRPNKSTCGSTVPTTVAGNREHMERKAYSNPKTYCPNIKTSKVWREPVPLDIFAQLALSDCVRYAQYPSAFDPLARHPFDPPDAHLVLVPSQVQFSKLKGSPIGFGNDVSGSVVVADADSDTDFGEAYVFSDVRVADGTMRDGGIGIGDEVSVAAEIGSDGFSTGIGFGNSFDTFNTKPEEEIIFESPAPVDSALVALLYHTLTTSTPVSDLGLHLIWEKFCSPDMVSILVLPTTCPLCVHSMQEVSSQMGYRFDLQVASYCMGFMAVQDGLDAVAGHHVLASYLFLPATNL